MKLPLVYYGNPLLRKKTEPVTEITDEIRQFIKDLEETMDSKSGLGIAAPQVGRSLAICILRPPIEDASGRFTQGDAKVYINPKLSDPSTESWSHEEACLSIPKVYGDVIRPTTVTVTAMDINGQEFTETLTGWPARVLMHENDHLNGVLFIDRISQKQRNAIEAQLRAIKKKYN